MNVIDSYVHINYILLLFYIVYQLYHPYQYRAEL